MKQNVSYNFGSCDNVFIDIMCQNIYKFQKKH